MLNNIFITIAEEAVADEIRKELEGVKKWHVKTFKDADLSGQLLKLEEEMKEVKEAREKRKGIKEIYKETADVLIVIAGLKRFNSMIGGTLLNFLLDKMSLNELVEILEALRQKMKINRARKWDKLKDGRFKHK